MVSVLDGRALARRDTDALAETDSRPRSRSSRADPPRRPRSVEIAVVVGLVILSVAAHAVNMFGYPYYENDEGTYISRAWQFITQGELDVYTYRYDHAPAGWMVLGAWLGMTGGATLFGSLLESGRVFMLVLHTASTVLLYVIARRMSGGMTAGIVAVLVFAVSPVGVYFQRRVLLDNIMVFWVLLAIALLLRKQMTLSSAVASGLVFGIAVLTKINAAFFGLGFLVLLWMLSAPHQRRHTLTLWLAFAGATVGLYFLYALLNREFFSAPMGPDGMPTHVSLIDTLGLQMGRGDPAPPWDATSNIALAFGSWLERDWLTIALGVAAIAGLAVVAAVRRTSNLFPLAVLLMIVGYIGFLARGGLVLDLYITPLVPLVGLGLGLVVASLIGWIRVRPVRSLLAAALSLTLAGTYGTTTPLAYASIDATSNQQEALEWVAENVPPSAVVVTDNYVYPALAQEGEFDRTLYFFSAEYDPESRVVYNDDWRDIDYLVVTHEFVEQVSQGTIPNLHEAFEHAELMASFTEGTSSYIDLENNISTNGDWVQVYRVKTRNDIVLQDTWQHYLDTWVHDYGRVAPTPNNSTTTSADQVTGLAQALDQGDEAWFRGIWQWTDDHLRHRENDELISRVWQTDADGVGSLQSTDTDCRSDLQAIELLLTAGTTWSEADDLSDDGRELAEDWWENCVIERDDLLYVDSTADGSIDDLLLNPSAHDPALYGRLSQQLPTMDWATLEDDGYAFLDRLIDELGTVPNWVVLTTEGELESASGLVEGAADGFGGEVLRLVPALIRADVEGDARAARILDVLEPQLFEYWRLNQSLPSSTIVTLLAQARDTTYDPSALYSGQIAPAYSADSGAWGSPSTLSDHYWGWRWHAAQAHLPETISIPLS